LFPTESWGDSVAGIGTKLAALGRLPREEGTVVLALSVGIPLVIIAVLVVLVLVLLLMRRRR
jgi:hypothetical protein